MYIYTISNFFTKKGQNKIKNPKLLSMFSIDLSSEMNGHVKRQEFDTPRGARYYISLDAGSISLSNLFPRQFIMYFVVVSCSNLL